MTSRAPIVTAALVLALTGCQDPYARQPRGEASTRPPAPPPGEPTPRLARLGDLLGPVDVERLASADPAVAWLVDAYSVGLDERAAAEAALAPVRPYIHSHGGEVEVLEAAGGVVRVRLSGACSGCTASSVTLTRGIEEALRENLPGFLALDAEQDTAPAHPPPGPTLLQIENRLGTPTP
jgi:Fe-S cluster biogenesis protein NfuA